MFKITACPVHSKIKANFARASNLLAFILSYIITLIIMLIIMLILQVCEEARCPNIGECWGGGENEVATATIMVR